MSETNHPQPVYVRPREIHHPTVLFGFAFMRPIAVDCGYCGRRVTRFSWNGRVRCDCGSINVPSWRHFA
jgi:hypothetical protein